METEVHISDFHFCLDVHRRGVAWYLNCSNLFYNGRLLAACMGCKRKPLQDEEIEINQNLKKKLKLPVTHIAKEVGRNSTLACYTLTKP